MRWPSQLRRRLCIVMLHSSVACIFKCFGESPQFAVIEEYTCYICIECSDFDCVADFSAVKKIVFSVLKASIAIIFLRLMSFSVSSRLQARNQGGSGGSSEPPFSRTPSKKYEPPHLKLSNSISDISISIPIGASSNRSPNPRQHSIRPKFPGQIARTFPKIVKHIVAGAICCS